MTGTVYLGGGGSAEDEAALWQAMLAGGGNTFDLLQEIRSHDFLEPVRGFVRARGSYYGGSAGAIVACDDIAIAAWQDANDIGLTDLSALGLVPDLAVLPHYEPGWRNDTQRWAQDHETTLLALPERTGLIVSGGTQTVVGQESAWIFSGAQSRENPPGRVSNDTRA